MNYWDKKKKLEKLILKYTGQDVVVAFSGGVDSSLLLKLACEGASKCETRVYACIVHTKLHPQSDIEIARRVCEEFGVRLIELSIDELSECDIKNNPVDRCYRCKKFLFTKMLVKAKEFGATYVLEGTNIDDTKVYRPGLRALEELEIISPLKEAGFTKAEVRKLAGELGISVANRPSKPCMATRFPYGTEIDEDKLLKVEQAEDFLSSLGNGNFRVRVHDNVARIEADDEYMPILLAHKNEVCNRLKSMGYAYITMDLQGFRSGSMDEVINTEV